MTRRVRRGVLTAHVTFAVGWLGAVAAFLVLAIAGLTSEDAMMVRVAYLAMKLITWFVILPFSFAAPLTGLVMALGTRWGLLRHYWILIKFLITIFSTVVLVIHLQPISMAAGVAAVRTLPRTDLGLQVQLAVAPAGALLLFLVNTTLAIYKPQGMTRYGRRKQRERLSA